MDYNSKYTGDEVEAMLDIIESKQDTIEDLEAIRDGAALGATALQTIPEEYVTEAELNSREFATTADLSGKVDKQTGKGLSTEDFTTYLKNKLEELSNYDDSSLTASVNKLRQEFDTLLNGDTSTAIETFNEIIAFLDGVSESDNLASIIASIEQQIAAKQDKIEGLDNLDEKLEVINSVIDEEGYLYSNGEKVDMRFTRSLLPVGTAIPANANLNTIEYMKIGKYYCSMNADAETITNCPVKVVFSMEVFNPLGTNVDDETTKAYTYRMRVLTKYDSGQQYLQFCRTGATPGQWTYDSWYVTVRSKSTLNSNKKGSTSDLGSATQGVYLDSTGTLAKMTYTLSKSVPSNAVFTDTNTKVTAVENHYAPAEDASSQLDAEEGYVVIGLKRDAAGHIVGIVTAPAPTGGGGDNPTQSNDIYYTEFTADDVFLTYQGEEGGEPIYITQPLLDAINSNKIIVVPAGDVSSKYLMIYGKTYQEHGYRLAFVGVCDTIIYDMDIRDLKVGHLVNLAAEGQDTDINYLRAAEHTEPDTVVKRDGSGSIKVSEFKDKFENLWSLPTDDVSGNAASEYVLQKKIVSGEDIKTLDGKSIVGKGNISVKTINGVSIFGTGDIPIGEGEAGSSVYVTSFTMDDLWEAITTLRENPEEPVIIRVNGRELFEAINARRPVLIPRTDYVGYAQVIAAHIDQEDTSYLTIADFDNVINIEFNSNALLQGDEMILDYNYIVVDYPDIGISPNTIVKRGADGSIGVSAIWDDAGVVWATESSSDEIKGNADYIIPYKRFPQVLVGEEVDIEELLPLIYYHTGGVLTSLTIRSLSVLDMIDEYTIHFFAGDAMELVLPANVLWANGEIPTIEGNTEYELSLTRYDNGGQNVIKAVLVKFS